MKKKYYYGNPVVVFGWSTHEGDESFEWSYTKFPDGTCPEEGKEYSLSEVWDKDLVFDGIHRDNEGGTSHVEVHYLDKTAYLQEGKYVADIYNAFTTKIPFKLSNGYTKYDSEKETDIACQFDKTKSYFIRRQVSSGPPKVTWIYPNDEGSMYDVDINHDSSGNELYIGSSIEALDTGVKYHTVTWNKVDAHLADGKWTVDKDYGKATFPQTIDSFHQYYKATNIPKRYRLKFYDTETVKGYSCFYDDSGTALSYSALSTSSYKCIISNTEGTLVRFSWSAATGGGENTNPDVDYNETITATVTFADYATYIPDKVIVYNSDMQEIEAKAFYKSDLDDSYLTTFNMPGQDIILKIYVKKNDSTN